MSIILRWIETIPVSTLVIATLLLGLAPFVPEPHLWEKLRWLIQGNSFKPIDIFDLIMHSSPLILLLIKLYLLSDRKQFSKR